MVENCVEGIPCGCTVLNSVAAFCRLTARLGATKEMLLVFNRFFAFRKMSWEIPPAATPILTVLGKMLEKVTGFLVASTRVIAAIAKWKESDLEFTTT